MARIDAFLKLGREQGASDVHLSVGLPPMIRLYGDLEPIKYRELSLDELNDLIDEILTEDQRETYRLGRDLDMSYQSKEGERYRVNLYHKLSGPGGTFRIIPPKIPTMKELALPEIPRECCIQTRGCCLLLAPQAQVNPRLSHQ